MILWWALQRMLLVSLGFGLLAAILIVWKQDFLIFPGAFQGRARRLTETLERDPSELPKGVSSFFVKTTDGERLEVWSLPASTQSEVEPRGTLVFFHGNGGDLFAFFSYLQFFTQAGFNSYTFDYRGYGLSSGHPSEEGLYLDSAAVIEAVAERSGVLPSELWISGLSIGSGPASWSAEKYQAKALVLLAPFASLPEVIRARPLLRFLAPLCAYTFPVAEHVSRLDRTALLVVHGKRDEVIEVSNGKRVHSAYQGTGPHELIIAEAAGHNDILERVRSQIDEALTELSATLADQKSS